MGVSVLENDAGEPEVSCETVLVAASVTTFDRVGLPLVTERLGERVSVPTPSERD